MREVDTLIHPRWLIPVVPHDIVREGWSVAVDDGRIAAVLPRDDLFDKSLSTVAEIRTRHGPVIAVTHPGNIAADVADVITVPKSEPELDAILLGIPLQLFAYHAAVALGRDVDQPRNLAKSVTVE